MLFDVTVPGLRHRMQRERGKQRFLPKRDCDVPLNDQDIPKAPTDGTEIEIARVGGDRRPRSFPERRHLGSDMIAA